MESPGAGVTHGNHATELRIRSDLGNEEWSVDKGCGVQHVALWHVLQALA